MAAELWRRARRNSAVERLSAFRGGNQPTATEVGPREVCKVTSCNLDSSRLGGFPLKMSSIQLTTPRIVASAAAAAALGFVSYALYFDYKRRNDPVFRKRLRQSPRLAPVSLSPLTPACSQGCQED